MKTSDTYVKKLVPVLFSMNSGSGASGGAGGGGSTKLSSVPSNSCLSMRLHLSESTKSTNSSSSISPDPSSSICAYNPMGASNQDLPRACPLFFVLLPFAKTLPCFFKHLANSKGEMEPPPSWSAFWKKAFAACVSRWRYSGESSSWTECLRWWNVSDISLRWTWSIGRLWLL